MHISRALSNKYMQQLNDHTNTPACDVVYFQIPKLQKIDVSVMRYL
jgi:hypothetical protein